MNSTELFLCQKLIIVFKILLRYKKQLEPERAKRERLSINYNKSLKVVNAAEGVLAVSFMGLRAGCTNTT